MFFDNCYVAGSRTAFLIDRPNAMNSRSLDIDSSVKAFRPFRPALGKYPNTSPFDYVLITSGFRDRFALDLLRGRQRTTLNW
jgi:hypothetical protein